MSEGGGRGRPPHEQHGGTRPRPAGPRHPRLDPLRRAGHDRPGRPDPHVARLLHPARLRGAAAGGGSARTSCRTTTGCACGCCTRRAGRCTSAPATPRSAPGATGGWPSTRVAVRGDRSPQLGYTTHMSESQPESPGKHAAPDDDPHSDPPPVAGAGGEHAAEGPPDEDGDGDEEPAPAQASGESGAPGSPAPTPRTRRRSRPSGSAASSPTTARTASRSTTPSAPSTSRRACSRTPRATSRPRRSSRRWAVRAPDADSARRWWS
jgi:non-specific serine/threonine protein kinase